MPVDHTVYKLSTSRASNTGASQSYLSAWDSTVVAEAGTIRAVTAVASSLTSSGRLNSADIYRQPSGTTAASNSSLPVTTAPLALVGNNTAVVGSIAQSNQRVAAGDILQLKTDIGAGEIVGLTATILVLPD